MFDGARVCLVVLAVVGSVLAVAPAAAAQGQRFPDVAADHYAFEAVEWAVEAGVTVGYTDGTFKPQRPLIRRHAVVFMERYYDEILGADESEDFTRGDMMVLLKAINDGTIRGEAPQDAAPGTDGAAQGQRFPDVAADHYAFEAVEWAVEAGVTVGYTDGTFKPQRPLIRRHAVVFMERYYDEILGADESEDFTRGDMMVLLKAINDGTLRTRPPGAESATTDVEPAISISDTHGCKLSTDGRLACWGDNTHGQATPPPGTYTDIAVSTNYSCAIRSDGQLACWGDNTDGRTSSPVGAFTAVTTGPVHPCGVRADSTIACWGRSHTSYPGGGSTDRPPPGAFTDISLGQHVGCGVSTDRSIQCWGWTSGTLGMGPSPQGTFTAVDVTHRRACALRTNGSITCWGSAAESVHDAPAGSHIAISTGGTIDGHSCALRTDGTITCWGKDTITLPHRAGEQPTTIAGLTSPPTGQYQALALTNHQACALRSDNTHTCWGTIYRDTVDNGELDANAQLVMDFLKTNIIDRYGPEHPWLQEVWNYALDSGLDFRIEPIRFAAGSPSRGGTTEHIEWRRLSKTAVADGVPEFEFDLLNSVYSSASGFVVPDATLLTADNEAKYIRELAHIYVESVNVLDDPTPIAVAQMYFNSYRNLWNSRQNDCYPIGLIVDIIVMQVAPRRLLIYSVGGARVGVAGVGRCRSCRVLRVRIGSCWMCWACAGAWCGRGRCIGSWPRTV